MEWTLCRTGIGTRTESQHRQQCHETDLAEEPKRSDARETEEGRRKGGFGPLGPIMSSSQQRIRRHSSHFWNHTRLTKRQSLGRTKRATSRQDPGSWGRLSRQPNEHVAEWHARSHGGVTLNHFEVDVAWCAERRGVESLADSSDEVAGGVSQVPAYPSKTTGVKWNPFRWHLLAVSWNVHVMLSYSVRFWVEVVVGRGFRVAGRRQEVTAKSEASGINHFLLVMAGLMWKTV